jgi:hypothetical protein
MIECGPGIRLWPDVQELRLEELAWASLVEVSPERSLLRGSGCALRRGRPGVRPSKTRSLTFVIQ